MRITDVTHPIYYAIVPQGAVITARAHGIDLSKYDVGFDPALTDKQLDFVFQRVSYGATRDEAFNTIWQGVQNVPIRMGYHYLSSHLNYKVQADAYLSYVRDYPFHAHVCDWEGAYNDLTTGFAKLGWDWCNYVQDKTGKPVILYTSLNLYNAYIAPSEAIYSIDWDRFAYWQAQWFLTPNPNGTPTMPTKRTGGWQFWQYTDKGSGYGTVRNYPTDLNVFNGNVTQLRSFLGLDVEPPPPQPSDVVSHPFNGVMQVHGERFGRKVYVNVIDPNKVRFEVRNEDGYPSQICRSTGAQIAWNGDDYDRVTRVIKNNDEPSLLIFPDRIVSIGNWRNTLGEQYHSSGLRYLVENGVNVIPVNGTEAKYTERHARSITGILPDGKVFHLTVDGDYPDKGALLWECGEIAREFGCVNAFDQGGGGDTVEVLNGSVVNVPDDDVNGIHYERKVPQTILVYAQENNMAYGTAIEKLGNIPAKRNAPSRYATTVGQLAKGGTIEFVEIVPVQPQGTADKAGETWFKLPDGSFVNYQLRDWFGRLIDYFTVLTMPSTDPVPTPEGETVVDVAFAADNKSVTVTVNTADMYGEATITLMPTK